MPGQWTLSQYWVLGWVPLALLLHQPAVQAGVTEGDVPWSKTEASDPVSALASSALAEPSPQDAVEERGNPVTALGDSPETGRSSLGLATALKEEPLSEIEQPAALAGRPQQSLLNTEGGREGRSQLIPSPLAVSHPKRPATRKQTRSKTPLLREFMAQEPPQADPPSAAGHWSASGHHEGRSLAAPNGRVNLPPHDDAELGLVEVQPPAADAELGIVEVQDPRLDSELGLIQLRSPLQDPELGILQLTPLALPPPPAPRPICVGLCHSI